jgi:UDP-glucose 4-epimerase
VQDCVQPLMKMGSVDAAAGEVINIGPDEEYVSILELANVIADILGFDLDPIFVTERPREVRYATCSADKARRILDYRTTVTLRQGLTSIVNWIQMNGTRPFEYHLPIEIDSPIVPETWKNRMI